MRSKGVMGGCLRSVAGYCNSNEPTAMSISRSEILRGKRRRKGTENEKNHGMS